MTKLSNKQRAQWNPLVLATKIAIEIFKFFMFVFNPIFWVDNFRGAKVLLLLHKSAIFITYFPKKIQSMHICLRTVPPVTQETEAALTSVPYFHLIHRCQSLL